MYKNILIAASLVLAALPGEARQGSDDLTTVGAVVGDLFPHFNTKANSNSGGQGVRSRLMAKARFVHEGHTFEPTDSVRYKYYGSRGGAPLLEEPQKDSHILFDESISYKFSKAQNMYENHQRRSQTFDGDNRIKTLTYQDWHTINSYWKNKERYNYVFDNNGKMVTTQLQLWYANAWSNQVLSNLTYDGNNNVTKMTSTNYNVNFVYQGTNLVKMEDNVWDATNGWQPNQRRSYTYTGSEIATYELEQYDVNSGTWNKSKRWEYSYNGTGQLTTTKEYFWDNGWRPKYQTQHTYNAKGNITVKIIDQWQAGTNSYSNYKKEEWQYNQYDQPTEIKEYSWGTTAYTHKQGDEYTRFYYEYYHPNSVQQLALVSSVNVYPVPANNTLNVQTTLDGVQPAKLVMIDMTGKTVYTKDIAATKQVNISIPVSTLASGNYLLAIQSGNNRATRQVAIKH